MARNARAGKETGSELPGTVGEVVSGQWVSRQLRRSRQLSVVSCQLKKTENRQLKSENRGLATEN
jgi:hypothetical protein